MSDPDIHQIVNALSRMDETHRAEKQAIRDEYSEANRRDREALERANWIIDRRDREVELLRDVLMDVLHEVSWAKQLLNQDLRNCVTSEPQKILKALPAEVDVVKVVAQAREKRKAEEKRRKALDLARRTGIWPLAPLEGASDRRRCACGKVWHMDEVPENHNGLECQPEPVTDPLMERARRVAGESASPERVAQVYADLKAQQKFSEETEDKAVECDCGRTWPDGRMAPGHGDMGCKAVCRVCGHGKDDHVSYGTTTYCASCWDDEYHEFDGSEPHPEDKCVCGCARKHHQGEDGLGGTQCRRCPGDEERTWRHGFHWDLTTA